MFLSRELATIPEYNNGMLSRIPYKSSPNEDSLKYEPISPVINCCFFLFCFVLFLSFLL